MKTNSQGTLTVPTTGTATGTRPLSERTIDLLNSIFPEDCQIRTPQDVLTVKLIMQISLTLVCPLFIIPSICTFRKLIKLNKGGANE